MSSNQPVNQSTSQLESSLDQSSFSARTERLLGQPVELSYRQVLGQVKKNLSVEIVDNPDLLGCASIYRTVTLFLRALQSNIDDAAEILMEVTDDNCKVKLAGELKSSIVAIKKALISFYADYLANGMDPEDHDIKMISWESVLVISGREAYEKLLQSASSSAAEGEQAKEKDNISKSKIQNIKQLNEMIINAATGMEASPLSDVGVSEFTRIILEARDMIRILIEDFNNKTDANLKLHSEGGKEVNLSNT
jgi:hypothetical protein